LDEVKQEKLQASLRAFGVGPCDGNLSLVRLQDDLVCDLRGRKAWLSSRWMPPQWVSLFRQVGIPRMLKAFGQPGGQTPGGIDLAFNFEL